MKFVCLERAPRLSWDANGDAVFEGGGESVYVNPETVTMIEETIDPDRVVICFIGDNHVAVEGNIVDVIRKLE